VAEPVHEWSGGWWFWDETWTFAYGPYKTEADAHTACREYGLFLEDGSPFTLPENYTGQGHD